MCIDQENIPDESSQLVLMKKIYRKSKTVYVDLGDVGPDWYCGFDLLTRVGVLMGKSDVEMALPSPDHLSWGAYLYIFMQPWFTKEWIVQEITLAQVATVMLSCLADSSELSRSWRIHFPSCQKANHCVCSFKKWQS